MRLGIQKDLEAPRASQEVQGEAQEWPTGGPGELQELQGPPGASKWLTRGLWSPKLEKLEVLRFSGPKRPKEAQERFKNAQKRPKAPQDVSRRPECAQTTQRAAETIPKTSQTIPTAPKTIPKAFKNLPKSLSSLTLQDSYMFFHVQRSREPATEKRYSKL